MTTSAYLFNFDSDRIAEPYRLEASREFLASTYRLSPAPEALARSFKASATAWSLGDVRLVAGHLSGGQLARTAPTARSDGQDQFSVFLTRGGRWRGTTGDLTHDAGPGQLTLLDRSKTLAGEVAGLHSIVLAFPYDKLDPAMRDQHGRTLGGHAGALLADHLVSLVRHVGGLAPAGQQHMGEVITGLVRACLAGDHTEAEVIALADVIRGRALRYIDANLTDPHLSPETICRALHISRSGLYRAFQMTGGVRTAIQNRRLEAVCTLLRHPREQRTIAELAETFCFASASHFTRAFRQRFGCKPRDFRFLKR